MLSPSEIYIYIKDINIYVYMLYKMELLEVELNLLKRNW